MGIITWRAQRKLAVLTVIFGTLAIIIGIYILFNLPEPSCFDGKLNQDEEDVDCGGVCEPCISNPKEIVVLWNRVFEMEEGVYEAGALVENPNLFYGMPVLKYTFKLFDANNILVSVKEGHTFLNPREKFIILTPPVNTGQRRPVRVSVELEPVVEWEYIKETEISLVVSEKRFFNLPFPTLEAQLFNESLFPVEDVYTAAVLYDENSNAIAVSSGLVDYIEPETRKKITFTWRVPFPEVPFSSEIFTRKDLTSSDFFGY